MDPKPFVFAIIVLAISLRIWRWQLCHPRRGLPGSTVRHSTLPARVIFYLSKNIPASRSWAGTAGFLALSEYQDNQPGQLSRDEFHEYIENRSKDVTLIELLRAGRIIAVMANTIVLAASFLYARRLLGAWPALLAFLLVAFDPFHLALTRLLHLDGLFSNFVLLALLAYCSYLQDQRFLDLVISAAAAGLGWLTKSPALFIVPGRLAHAARDLALLQPPQRSFSVRVLSGSPPGRAGLVHPKVAVFISLGRPCRCSETLSRIIAEPSYAGEAQFSLSSTAR
jgi:hypothetical protein